MKASMKQPIDNKFDKFRIDLSKEVVEPQPLLKIGEKPLFTRGNISCIGGQAKSRKSFLISLFSSLFLEYTENEKVIIFDTEQAKYHVQKATKRIHKLLKWNDNQNNERLHVFTLRELSIENRKECITNMIELHKPSLVFIDGIRDLLPDFNNPTESSEIVNLLMRLSSVYDCHICSVLHKNKGKDDLRGHTGTELQNKSETVISVEKKGDISEVKPMFCRNIPFDDFYFRVNDDSLPELCNPDLIPKNTDKLKQVFKDFFPDKITLSYTELQNKIMESCAVKETAAGNKIKNAKEQRIIAQNPYGKYQLVSDEHEEKSENQSPH